MYILIKNKHYVELVSIYNAKITQLYHINYNDTAKIKHKILFLRDIYKQKP